MDLVYLFIDINYINNENVPINGYLMGEVNISRTGLERISSIEPQPDNFIQCLNDISFKIFEELKFDISGYANALPLIKKIYNQLLKNDINDNNNIKIRKLCEILINLFNEDVLKILKENYSFNLEDIKILDFIENYKYLENESICKNYPSLIYFLVENKINNKNFFNYNSNDKNNMPFWLFCLRYYSSVECIISKENNYFSKLIDKCIKERLLIELKKIRKKNIGIDWLNLICNNKLYNFYKPQ